VRVLVTGADGFVGRYLVRRLLERGDEVGAACRPGGPGLDPSPRVTAVPFELTDERSVRAALDYAPHAVVHLAAVASTREARDDPGRAWTVNAGGTARLAEALAARGVEGAASPLLLVISSGEVYGAGDGTPRRETDELRPISSYAATKVGTEVAALEVWRRAGLRVVVARPFTHTGAGQDARFVLPAFASRLREARATGAREVPTGNLDPVRDLLDVRDVVEAYLALLELGEPGEIYNIARGEGVSLREIFRRLADLVGVAAEPRPSAELTRRQDIPHLVGNTTKLRQATGWSPRISLDATLRGLVDAQAD
jgi:GDP-4-dehydro-6-deoxy-D-mannose reductase